MYKDQAKNSYQEQAHLTRERPQTEAERLAAVLGSRLDTTDMLDRVTDYLLDPVTGSNAKGKQVIGVLCIHVDDLFFTGTKECCKQLENSLSKEFQIGSLDTNDVMFTGQRVRWKDKVLEVDQTRCIEELTEVTFDKSLKDNIQCDATMHTSFRSVLGQLNWLQSRTQFHIAYSFSRCASAASKPTIGDVRALNKAVRTVRSNPVVLRFHNIKTPGRPCRILGIPDAAYRNNTDGSSQRGQTIFLAAPRERSPDTRGSLIDYESQRIKRTVLSTTVSELYSFMKCFGTCQFLKGLWADISGESSEVHMRTDANNLVTTASTTHLPEQKETIHMIQMLRKESGSGSIDDLAHVRTEHCLSDCLTKNSAKPDALLKAVSTGILKTIDFHPAFRSLLKHKAYLASWIVRNIKESSLVETFLALPVAKDIQQVLYSQCFVYNIDDGGFVEKL